MDQGLRYCFLLNFPDFLECRRNLTFISFRKSNDFVSSGVSPFSHFDFKGCAAILHLVQK